MEKEMKLLNIELAHKDKYTNLYHLNYKNLNNDIKTYEVVSRKDLLKEETSLGNHIDAITMIIKHKSENKYLILKEFRLSVNRFVYNFVAGLIDDGETPLEACIREVFEETNIKITKDNIKYELNDSYSAIGLSDERIKTFFVEIDGKYELRRN